MTKYLEGFAVYKPYPRPLPSLSKLLPQLEGVVAASLAVLGVQPLTWKSACYELAKLETDDRSLRVHDKIEKQVLEYEARQREFEAWHTPDCEAA